MRTHRAALFTAVTMSTLGLAAGIAYATIPDAGGTIHGCYKKSGGTLRVIDDSVTSCASNEVPLQWSTQASGAAGGDLDGSYPDPTIRDGAVDSAAVANNSLTGDDIDEASLGQVAAAGLGGIGRRSTGSGFCNPDTSTYFTCAFAAVDLPIRTRVLVLATVKAQPWAGVRAPGNCRLATSTDEVLASYSFSSTDVEPSIVPLIGLVNAGPGRIDFGVECNDPAAPEFDAAYFGASVFAVALSPS